MAMYNIMYNVSCQIRARLHNYEIYVTQKYTEDRIKCELNASFKKKNM